MWSTLASLADKFMSILKIVVTSERLGHVVAWIQGSAIQRIDEADLIFIDNRCVEQADVEETGFCFIAPFD